MRGPVPPRPTGSDREAIFAQMAWDAKHGPENQLRDSTTIKWTKTSRGIFGKVIGIFGGSSTPNTSGNVTYDPVPYSSTTQYAQFTIVRKTSGASQGIWIRIANGTAAGIDPVFPEPTTGTVTWHCLGLAIQIANICAASGTQTIYIQATAPV